MAKDTKHRNDIYGDIEQRSAGENPAIPAATVVLVRDLPTTGIEVLMLKKNTNISFGGMWVFPGGRIDDADYEFNETDLDADGNPVADNPSAHLHAAAVNAAVRETQEETGLLLQDNEFVWFSHWTPPASTPRRYATWFFATALDSDDEILVDGEEITKHQWISPAEALDKHAAGHIDLAPPTWITLNELKAHSRGIDAINHLRETPEKIYETRVVKAASGERVALWHGDAGYVDWNAEIDGDRHRLVLASGGFRFEYSLD